MQKTKRPLSFLLAVLMIVSVFAAVPFTASAEDKVIGENVIYKQGDTIVLPGEGTYYVKDSESHPAQEISGNGTVTRFEGDEYSYTVEIGGWYIYARLDTFDYWEELNQGQSVLGITFSGSGTESDPYLPKLALGEVESTWAGEGEGTEASPWLINDLNDLRTLSANVASGMTYSGKYLKLAADIDCGSDNWETIGGDKSFAGTFDGDGKTITYSIICSENDAPKGLFAKIGSAGTVKNLNVAGSIVNTAEYAGPAGGIAAYNSGLIENCYSAVDINKGCDRGTGGIAAWNDEGATIRYCAASGTLTWTGASDFYAYIGGITGENYNYNDEESEIKIKYVTNCAILGNVLAQNATDQYNYAGRLIGRQYDASTSDDCYYLDTMTVTGVVNSDSVTAKTAEELKAIGQAAIDAGYTVYGLALGGSLSNPDQEAADPVSYLVWDDAARKLVEMTGDNACKTYTEVTADTATFEDGMWYVVNGEILNGNRITVTGTAHLILTDGSKLTTNNGINVANGSTLNIYGQGAGTGTVTANGGSNKGAGIGGKQNESGGTVNIYGGTVTATGSGGGAGIGGGYGASGGTGGTITIYGGTVTANGSGLGGAGIGGGSKQSTGIVTIYGGTVTANGNWRSPGIGPGANGDGGTLTVCGGSVTAVGDTNAIAIACTVKNTFPGTGWTNVNGTADETPIEINTEGQELTDFKKVQFLGVASIPNDQQFVTVDDQISITLSLDLGTRGVEPDAVSITLAGNAYDAQAVAAGEGVYNYKIEMSPAQIADEIVATISGDAQPLRTSVMGYCLTLCGHDYDDDAAVQNLAKAILQYGKASNSVFEYTETNIVTADTLDTSAVQEYTGMVFNDTTSQVTGASFMALTKPEFRFYTSNITEEQGYAYNQAGVTATMTGGKDKLNARFVINSVTNEVLIEVTGVSAENMDKTITVNVTGLGTITFNGNTFAKAMTKSGDTAQSNLGAALYNYGVAAKTYFNA